MDQGFSVKRKKNPKEKANFFSLLSFAYVIPLFSQGYRKDLDEDDVYQIVKKLRSKTNADALEVEWEFEKFHHKRPSAFRLLMRCYGKRYLILGLIQLVVETGLNLFRPFALGKLVLYFTIGQTELTDADAYLYASLVIGLGIFIAFYEEHYHMAKIELGMEIRMAFCSLIYRKALRLHPSVLREMSTGKIVTILTKDVHSIDLAIHFANEFWVELIQAIFMFFLIYNKVGTAAFVTAVAFALTFPIQAILSKLVYWKRGQTNKKSDERLQLTQEILSVIRIIKMYTWETFFCEKVTDARKKEINKLRKIFYMKDGGMFLGGLIAKLSYYLVLLVYIALGNNLTAEVVYYVSSCFGKLRYILTYLIPLGLAECAEVLASLKRINYLLNAEEVPVIKNKKQTFMATKILMRNATVKIGSKYTLEGLNLTLEPGLNIMIGLVGSGKSTIIKTLLQEYKISNGNLFINGEISYASQQPWLFPSTIRQNILFGKEYDESRYRTVVDVCALKLDFEMFANGDLTCIGDCGTNLSKGQQARINLARAVYREADIYLLDDSLSSLDVNVQNYIYKNCIKEFLRNKLVLFVTHNNSFLKNADQIILLSDGKISYTGAYDEVSIKNIYNELDSAEINCDIILPPIHQKAITNGTKKEEKECMRAATNVYREEKKEGHVDWTVYKRYICFGGWFLFTIIIFLHVSVESVNMFGEKVVSKWVNQQTENVTELTEHEKELANYHKYVMIYTISGILVATVVSKVLKSIIHFLFSFRAAKNIHRAMIYNVVNAKMQFFDQNMIGNILNRFSKDLGLIDEYLPYLVSEVIRILCIATSTIILIISVNLLFAVVAISLLGIFLLISILYLPTGRSLKRLDASTRSPVIGHLNATLEGLTSVRAFQTQDILMEEFDKHQDLYISAQYMFQLGSRLLTLTMNCICSIFVGVILSKFLFFNTGSLAGDVGLALTQAYSLGAYLQWGIRNWISLESNMTSVERVLEYVDVVQENNVGKKLEDWPSKGSISFNKVSLTYRLNNEQVLTNINIAIRPNEKIGIVGRTGAGKSSIIVALYRMYDIEGTIAIDNEDISELSLDFLRSNISIIPQEPVIFSGTMRTNIDPYNKCTDKEIWDALEAVNLKDIVKDLDADSKTSYNLSLGQKQLLSIARAVVRKNRIVVLDEATANMDIETERFIHDKINEMFKNCTIIIVAHRMETIIGCDKVIVMDKGKVIEFDGPKELTDNPESEFHKMVKKSGVLTSHVEK